MEKSLKTDAKMEAGQEQIKTDMKTGPEEMKTEVTKVTKSK